MNKIHAKKGMELSMNTIIIGVIVLIVLIVIAILFTGGLGKTNKGISDCDNKGGTCCSQKTCIANGGMPGFTMKGQENDDDPEVCCLLLSDTKDNECSC